MTLIQWKITKLQLTQEPLGLEKKITADLESLEFYEFFNVGLAKFENNQILLNEISHRFLVAINLFKAYLHVSPISH